MKITIISIGKIKEKYLNLGIDEYLKRLSRYVKLNVIEVSDESLKDNMSLAQQDIVLKKEGEKILYHIKQNDYVIALAINGNQLSSEELSQFLQNNMTYSIGNIIFVIGGSIGLSKEVLNRADYKLSFSNMTFPHQLMKIILLEQIYRAYKIMNNETYHK